MKVRLLAVVTLLMLTLPAGATLAAGSADFAVSGGWFYSQANGQGGGPGQPGYTITNDAGILFYTTFKARGGVPTFGYPASPRLTYGGFTDQITQKSVFQWAGDHTNFLNVMDVLHDAGKDAWLQTTYQTPPPEDTSPDTGLTFAQVVARHDAFLDSNPALQAAYFAVPDPLSLYGLPLTHPTSELNGQVIVVRCQRAVLQQWTVTVPWAAAGQVTVANGGDIFKASGLIPASALAPQPAPGTTTTANVSAVMLTTADLPGGFTQNARASRSLANGAVGVFQVSNPLSATREPVVILDAVEVTSSAAEAQSLLTAASLQSLVANVPALANSQFQPIAAPTIGQKTVAYSAAISAAGQSGTLYLIGFTEGNYLVVVGTAGLPNTVSVGNTAGYAGTIDSRILAQGA